MLTESVRPIAYRPRNHGRSLEISKIRRLNEKSSVAAPRHQTFLALDHRLQTRPARHKTKELLGLVASAVLRCDDCITYHWSAAAKKVEREE